MTIWGLVCAALAGYALVTSWRHETLRGVGVTMAVTFVLSTVNFNLWLADVLSFDSRVTISLVLDVAVGSAAFIAFMCGGSRALTTIVVLYTASVCATIAIAIAALDGTPSLEQRHLWNAIEETVFVLARLSLIGTAWVYRARDSRRRNRPSNARLVFDRDGAWTGNDR